MVVLTFKSFYPLCHRIYTEFTIYVCYNLLFLLTEGAAAPAPQMSPTGSDEEVSDFGDEPDLPSQEDAIRVRGHGHEDEDEISDQ